MTLKVFSACVPVCNNTDETLFSSRTLGIVITSNKTFFLFNIHEYETCLSNNRRPRREKQS